MSSKRLNDTAALVAIGNPAPDYVTVTKIDNGFLVRESGCEPNGEYSSKETFHAERPEIRVSRIAPKAGSGGLKDTMSYLKSKKSLAFVLALGVSALASPAGAQHVGGQSVTVEPQPLATVNASSTVTSTNTFQSVFAAAGPVAGASWRLGCQIQNLGATDLFVFYGAIASATTPKSVKLNPGTTTLLGGSTFCERGGSNGVIQDQVSVTGTALALFYAVRY